VWTAANAVVLVLLSVWVLHLAVSTGKPPAPLPAGELAAITSPSATPSITPQKRIPTKDDFVAPIGQHFGVSFPSAPFGKSEFAAISRNAAVQPTMIEYFIKWNEDFRPIAATACYDQGALPMVAWEPWAGSEIGTDQPKYALRKIINGAHDPYITRFAQGVKAYKWPIVLRFAHEMNGAWFPWSERNSGNKPGEYVRAWQHVHKVFEQVGATNVIWVWSPNIIRPVPSVQLAPLYPGDDYVDWVGMVGYAVREKSAGAVFDPTINRIRKFTKKPMLITETGAKPGELQAGWTADLFRWLARHEDVVGFIWFEYDKAEWTYDWRFSRDRQTMTAFRAGLAQSDLVPPVRP